MSRRHLCESEERFWNIGVQMVPQVRDIDLTPERPNHEPEMWHIQGQNNERIAGTAHYIYWTDKISLFAPPTEFSPPHQSRRSRSRQRLHNFSAICTRDLWRRRWRPRDSKSRRRSLKGRANSGVPQHLPDPAQQLWACRCF